MSDKPFIVPGVCRLTIHQSYFGQNVANVLDYFVDTTGSTVPRQDACAALALDVLNNWVTNILGMQVTDMKFNSVSWVDLDDEDGSVGAFTQSPTNTLPKTGTGGTGGGPGGVAVLVHKRVVAKRNTRSGRMYLGGISESANDNLNPNLVQAGFMSTNNPKLATFLSETNQSGTALIPGFEMRVVHITERYDPEPGQELGSPKLGDSSQVTSLTIDPTMATQRRRQR